MQPRITTVNHTLSGTEATLAVDADRAVSLALRRVGGSASLRRS